MKNIVMIGFVSLAIAANASMLVKYDGLPNAKSGWTTEAQEEGKVVYVPFEGYYESKGGRILSPKIALDKEIGKTAFYSLKFRAKSKVQGYWWVDLYNEKGDMLPDINSAVYQSDELRDYDVVFTARCDAHSVRLSFIAKSGFEVRDVSLEKISAKDAAKWCNDLKGTLPPMKFVAPADSFAKLPKTREALKTGKPWRVVMLGDSIINDTFTSNFQSLIMEDFPKSNVEFINSVRGSTGVWYYKDEDKFNEYVTELKPDLVMIGGISNPLFINKCGDPEKNLVKVIDMCKKLGVEIVVMSPPPSYEWRKSPTDAKWNQYWRPTPEACQVMLMDYQIAACKTTGVPYWDMTTQACEYIDASRKPLDWFKRDGAHNNDRGKQVIGQLLATYFRTASK